MTILLLLASAAIAAAPSVGLNAAAPQRVAQYGRLDVPLDVATAAENPFDTRQVAVDALVTTPSGRELTVPCFVDQAFRMKMADPAEPRRSVRLLKVFVARRAWPQDETFRLFVDAVELHNSETGEAVALGRFDVGPQWYGQEASAQVVDVEGAAGDKALCITIPPGSKGWPGAQVALAGADWSAYDSVSLWIYPQASSGANISVEYYTTDGRKLSKAFGPAAVKLNEWNHLVWKWEKWPIVKSCEATGARAWRLRFSPSEIGRYECRLRIKDIAGEAEAAPFSFACVAAEGGDRGRGFLHVGPDKRYFQYDNGVPYFAIGHNVCWPSRVRGIVDYERYFKRMAANGENYARLWMCPWVFGVQWGGGPYHYRLDQAWALDHVLDLADEHGIKIMLCLDWHGTLKQGNSLVKNPYMKTAGGPCESPKEFFTNAEAKRIYKDRLRYLVARYGCRTNLLCWEFWNEVDLVADYDEEAVAAWHAEMGDYLRKVDPYDHMITTSTANAKRGARLWALPQLDFSQVHRYNGNDKAADMWKWCQDREQYGKPYLIGEFGFTTHTPGRTAADEKGLHMHNGIWGAMMAGSAGTAMLWWWDSYIEPKNLYYHFKALAAFATGTPWTRAGFKPVEAQVAFAPGFEAPPSLLRLASANGSWQEAPFNKPNRVTISRTGQVDGREKLSKIMHGRGNHSDLHNPVTFDIDAAFEGQFIVEVRGVSGHGGADLQIVVDNTEMLFRDFVDPDGKDGTQTRLEYNGDYAVTLTPGRHVVEVANSGQDWVNVAYRLEGLCAAASPHARAFALKGKNLTLLWIQNKDSNWGRMMQGGAATVVHGAEVRLDAMPAGEYEVEWWDTWRGQATRTERTRVSGAARVLVLRPGPVASDIACKVRRVR